MGVNLACLDIGEEKLPYLEVVSLRAGEFRAGVVTCEAFYEVWTHFIGFRTLPCMGDECGACAAHRPKRYEAFASVLWVAGKRHEIVRLTRNAMFMAKSALVDERSPRGRIIEIERKQERANGRLTVHFADKMIPDSRLPVAPDLPQHLARIWRIDGIECTADDRAYIAQMGAFLAETVEKGKVKHAV